MSMLDNLELSVPTAADMESLGGLFAQSLVDISLRVHLHGPLGAGKTTLVRGILRGLGYSGAVKSPTYTLVESYTIENLGVHHFDLYRLSAPDDLEHIGFRDYVDAGGVIFVEWPEQCGLTDDQVDIAVQIDYAANEGRIVRIRFHHVHFAERLISVIRQQLQWPGQMDQSNVMRIREIPFKT